MEIASKYEIAAANLAIALQTDTVSVEQRSELRAAIGSSIDKLVDALNMIIVCYNKRMYAGEIAPEKAAKCVKAEYAAIGLDTRFQFGEAFGLDICHTQPSLEIDLSIDSSA